jgi:hypothetical protein
MTMIKKPRGRPKGRKRVDIVLTLPVEMVIWLKTQNRPASRIAEEAIELLKRKEK